MDPDETLRQIRSILRAPTSPADGDASKNVDALAEHVSNLDEWLSRGGFAPSAWSPNPSRTPFELPRSQRMLRLGMEVSDRVLQLVDKADEYTRGDLQAVTEALAYDLVQQVFEIARSTPETAPVADQSHSSSVVDMIAIATPRPTRPGPQTPLSAFSPDKATPSGVDDALDL
ncbi:MAG: hypothetical protein HOQ24_01400 [Mycobacteriaceae bacterium]|nr:hypothetical protein [Mycobacteriaceae bacterium]